MSKPADYREQNGCHNCLHCFQKFDYDEHPSYFCALNAPPRPQCMSVAMEECWRGDFGSDMEAEHKDFCKRLDAWHEWAMPREVQAFGICQSLELHPEQETSDEEIDTTHLHPKVTGRYETVKVTSPPESAAGKERCALCGCHYCDCKPLTEGEIKSENELLLSKIRALLETGDSLADQMGGIRATLLVNFGKDSKHNHFGFSIEDRGKTHDLLVEVLEKLWMHPSPPQPSRERHWSSHPDREDCTANAEFMAKLRK